jgi:hypothetical protein
VTLRLARQCRRVRGHRSQPRPWFCSASRGTPFRYCVLVLDPLIKLLGVLVLDPFVLVLDPFVLVLDPLIKRDFRAIEAGFSSNLL